MLNNSVHPKLKEDMRDIISINNIFMFENLTLSDLNDDQQCKDKFLTDFPDIVRTLRH